MSDHNRHELAAWLATLGVVVLGPISIWWVMALLGGWAKDNGTASLVVALIILVKILAGWQCLNLLIYRWLKDRHGHV